jgi:hypothetical protein
MDPDTPQRDALADDLQGEHQAPDARHDATSQQGQDRVRPLNAQDALSTTPVEPETADADAPILHARQTDSPIESPLEDEGLS